MIDLQEYVKKLKVSFGIEDDEFYFAFSRFFVDNNWFGEHPVFENGQAMVSEKFCERIKNQVNDFCKYYNADTASKKDLLESKLESILPKTKEVFSEYCSQKGVSDDVAYYLLDFLLYFLPGEICFSDDVEIGHLMDDAYKNLSKVYGEIFADFLNWTNKNYKTSYRNMYFMNARSSRAESSSAYSPNEYLEIMYCLYNKDFIEENSMYEKASRSKNYIDTWLYLSLHFICALRNTDLIRIPHPRLTMEPQEVLYKVGNGAFSDEDARLTIYSILWNLSVLPQNPNKTKGTSGVPSIKFFVPESIEVHIGTLFAIAEAYYELNNTSPDEPLIRVISSYEQISRYMGDEIGDLFLESNFHSRQANKSYMQMIYLLTDDILQNDDEFNVKGYVLAALARSHKGSYGEFAKTTSTYLKDAKMNGYSPEFVAKELFERGVLSFIPSMLLKMITNGEYDKLSVENQTKMINELKLTPYEIENIVGLAQKSHKQSAAITKHIFANTSKDEIIKILHRIGNGNAVSKQDGCLCIITAMNKLCPYNDRKNCVGCQYEISTKSTMFLMVSEYKRLTKQYSAATNAVMKDKYKNLAREIVLPSIDEMLQCVEEQYGHRAIESLEKIIKEMGYAE